MWLLEDENFPAKIYIKTNEISEITDEDYRDEDDEELLNNLCGKQPKSLC